jgi:hypothetical protein
MSRTEAGKRKGPAEAVALSACHHHSSLRIGKKSIPSQSSSNAHFRAVRLASTLHRASSLPFALHRSIFGFSASTKLLI